jgi:hypothetical protein
MGRTGILQRMRRAGFWLAALALLAKAWLPAGYMAGVDDADKLTIMLCGLGDRSAMVLDLESGALVPADEANDHRTDEALAEGCAFALAAVAALASPDLPVVAPVRVPLDRVEPLAPKPALTLAVRPPLPARGPPTFA